MADETYTVKAPNDGFTGIRAGVHFEDGEGQATHNGFVSSALNFWYNEDLNNQRYPNDLQAAADVLADAGFRWDEDRTLYLPEDAPDPNVKPAKEVGLER